VLDLNKPEKLDFIKVVIENQPVNLLMVSRGADSGVSKMQKSGYAGFGRWHNQASAAICRHRD
jgi:hypothetical protein